MGENCGAHIGAGRLGSSGRGATGTTKVFGPA
jgi:hypothetical protein